MKKNWFFQLDFPVNATQWLGKQSLASFLVSEPWNTRLLSSMNLFCEHEDVLFGWWAILWYYWESVNSVITTFCELLLSLHVKLRLCQVCHKRSSQVSLVGHINTFFCVKYQMPTHTDLCSTTQHSCLCPVLLLLSTGCQKSHRIGGSHGETENEGWSETGEQYIVSSRCHEFQMDCILVVVSSLKSEFLHYLL